jgi:small neutral amino acid transporter SnatA (MarC family)
MMFFYILHGNYQLQIFERSLLPFKISASYISTQVAQAMMIRTTPRFKLLVTEKNKGG